MGGVLAMTLLIGANVAAQEQCGFDDRLFRSHFDADDAPPATLPALDTPLTVSIDPVFAGLTTSATSLAVYGQMTGPPATGVSIDSMPARQVGTRWMATVPLALGDNTLTVTATALTGETVQTDVLIQRMVGPSDEVVARAEGVQTYASGQARIRITPPAGRTIVSAAIDLRDDGMPDMALIAPAAGSTTRLIFPQPGFYPVKITGLLDDGDPVTPEEPFVTHAPVLMEHTGQTRLQLCHVFGQMRSSLVASNIPEAIKALHPRLHARFQALWTDLGDDLPEVALQLGQIADGTLTAAYADLLIARPVPGPPGEFLAAGVRFARGSDGVWRILDM